MENFFYDDEFCGDLSNIMDLIDIEDPKELNDDWTCKIELAKLEPIFKVDANNVFTLLCDSNEERLGEDFDSREEARILKAIAESFDFEKLKELLPKYYYPSNEFKTITKQDLIDYCS